MENNFIDILINIGMFVTYALLGVAVLGLLFFAIKQTINNLGRSKTVLYGIIALVVVFALAMALSSGTDISELVFEKTGTNYGSSRIIGAGLITTYILFFGTIVVLLATEIMRPFKK